MIENIIKRMSFAAIIFILFIVAICCCVAIYATCPNLHLSNSVVPFYERRDKSFPKLQTETLTILPTSGLSNRIRTILGFRYVCVKKNIKLRVIWISDGTCNGNYLDYFEPIPDVEFVNMFTNDDDTISYKGQSDINTILSHYDIPYTKELEYEMYKAVKIREDVISSFKSFDLSNHVGIHVRRTDFTGNWLGKLLNGFNSDEEFFEFIRKHTKGRSFYLATDNKETQDLYIETFGRDKVLFNKRILKNTKNLRKTPLIDAIADIYFLSKCKSIKGTKGSSFTDLAHILSNSKSR